MNFGRLGFRARNYLGIQQVHSTSLPVSLTSWYFCFVESTKLGNGVDSNDFWEDCPV